MQSKVNQFTGNLITMLCLLKISTFSTAIHHISDIIQNVLIFETLEALPDIKTERKK